MSHALPPVLGCAQLPALAVCLPRRGATPYGWRMVCASLGESSGFRIQPLVGSFGAEACDIDVCALSDAALERLLLCLYRNRFVVLRTGGLTKAQYVAFARRVGEPIRLSRDADYPEIADITNIGVDTRKERRGAAHWHTDQSFRKTVSSVTMLYSVRAPATGGETQFCNMAAAYAALPAALRERIEGLTVEHRHGVSVAARPGDHVPIPPKGWHQSATVHHPLVRRHPITGEKTLYAPTGTSQGIKDMPQREAAALLEALCDHAFQQRFLASHAHSPCDLLMWDNPTVMHRATPIGIATGAEDTRLIHRISLRGTPSVFR